MRYVGDRVENGIKNESDSKLRSSLSEGMIGTTWMSMQVLSRGRIMDRGEEGGRILGGAGLILGGGGTLSRVWMSVLSKELNSIEGLKI